jgi:hypothetical protein
LDEIHDGVDSLQHGSEFFLGRQTQQAQQIRSLNEFGSHRWGSQG